MAAAVNCGKGEKVKKVKNVVKNISKRWILEDTALNIYSLFISDKKCDSCILKNLEIWKCKTNSLPILNTVKKILSQSGILTTLPSRQTVRRKCLA